jgi:hypothetical protein
LDALPGIEGGLDANDCGLYGYVFVTLDEVFLGDSVLRFWCDELIHGGV